MNADELRALSQKLTNHAIGYGDYAIAGHLREAAEVLELLAMAEENGVRVARGPLCWIAKVGDEYISAPTLIDTLRRSREAAR